MTTPATAEQLAADICDSINELAEGRDYPDLIDAVRQLAAMAKAAEGAEPAAEVEEYRLASCINAVGGYQTFPAEVRVKWNRPIPVVGTRLYTRPQQVALTEDDVSAGYSRADCDYDCYMAFECGVRFAEEKHGIGGAR